MRYVHLGIDYGTSASKVLVRDYNAPGGEKVYPLMLRESFRIPADLAIVGNTLYLGRVAGDTSVRERASWYRSVKMRVAGNQRGSSDEQRPPKPWTFNDLATLSVAWLIRQGRGFAMRMPSKPSHIGMTLGLPSDYRFDPRLKVAFLRIAKAAWMISKKSEPITDEYDLTEDLRREVTGAIDTASNQLPSEDEMNLWIRSEARASIWWAWRSPKLTTAPYVKVDVGAGTTNVAAFLIREATPHLSKGISVLGATSGNVGMNALVTAAGGAAPKGFPPLSTVLAAHPGLKGGLEDPYRRAFGQVYERTGSQGPARDQWRQARVVMLGGGGLSREVSAVFGFDPRKPTHVFEKIAFDNLPPDLQLGNRINKSREEEARVSLTVAYGLSVLEDTLPSELQPGDIVPIDEMKPGQSMTTLAGVYEK